MCTVSWSGGRGGYDLVFNRDELNTRAPETPPACAQHDGVNFLSPRDGDHGGTWVLANQFGLTICLLNDYGAAWRPSAAVARFSRGHLVLAGAVASDHASVIGIVNRQPLRRTPAFHLLVLSPEEGPLVLHWNGTTLAPQTQSASLPLLSSSSFETAGVIAARTARFGEMIQSPDRPEVRELAAYHRQHDPGRGSHAVLMRRSDAATRSITQVTLRDRTVTMTYEPLRWALRGPEFLAQVNLTLPRHRGATCAA